MSRALVTRSPDSSIQLIEPVAKRWSPRSFDPTKHVDLAVLKTALEAARWSPSAYNAQPWRFAVALRGTELFTQMHSTLNATNQIWAQHGGVFVLLIADLMKPDGQPNIMAQYDVGQAAAYFTTQATADGLSVRQMMGFNRAGIVDLLDLEERFEPQTILAVGYPGDPEVLEEYQHQQEVDPRSRRSLEESLLTGPLENLDL